MASFIATLEALVPRYVSGISLEDAVSIFSRIEPDVRESILYLSIVLTMLSRKAWKDTIMVEVKKNVKLTSTISDFFTLNGELNYTLMVLLGHAILTTEFLSDTNLSEAIVRRFGSRKVHEFRMDAAGDKRRKIYEEFSKRWSNDALVKAGERILDIIGDKKE